jgi:uncharacterized membrane protein (UPF0182 family)
MRTISPPQPSRVRVFALIAVAVLFVLFLSANGVASFYTDWLWFDNMDLGSLWTTILGTKLLLGVIFSLVFFAILWGNLYFADRLKPETRPESPEEDLVERYHAVIGSQAGKVRFGVAALFGLIAGANTSSQWQSWLLFRNGGDFGQTDAQFGRDVGFYVFRLPFLSFVVDWFFAALVLTLIVVVVAHYLNGGIRASVPQEQRVSSGVKFHLSLLLAALALLRAVAYWLDRFHLVTSTRGAYDGALATDVNIQLPALDLLVLISLFCAALFVANIRRPGWGLPAVAIGIWLVSHFIIGGLFPLVYQRVRVVPEESAREAMFVERNIEATRFAYGLNPRSEEFDYEPELTATDLQEYEDVLTNVPVVDPRLATEEVTRSEARRSIYSFSSVLDVDRYEINGETRPVVLSARGLNVGEVGDSWEPQHVIFTHGHGLAMAAAFDETATVSGESRNLDYLVRGLGESQIDEELAVSLDQPRIYFGEDMGGYAIVGATRDEVDFQTASNESVPYRYTGEGGVPMGSVLRRAAFALRFRELDPLISQNVTADSRAIYNREIRSRAEQLAPFLRFDEDPYPVAADGGLFWIIDGYTTTSDFPYSQSVDTGVSGDLSGGYNYVRNSVKVVIDAYNGTTTMYVIDDTDPVIDAWTQVFPELFTDGDEMPTEIRSHLRYPRDIFTVQTDMWTNYVVSDATEFIQGDVAWSIAAQPRTEAQTTEADTVVSNGLMQPQYLMARVPGGGNEAEFVLQRAFVPRSGAAGTITARPKLTGVMMARSDPENYGELVLVRLPGGEVDAPDLVHSDIRKNENLTDFIRDNAGATVEFGDMSVLLLEDTIVYVRPVYVEANSATAVPELQRVIAVNSNRIFMGGSIAEAVRGVVSSGALPALTEETEDGETPDDSYDPTGKSVVELISDAEELIIQAADAEGRGFPDDAARMRAGAQIALAAARDLLGGITIEAPAAEEEAPLDAEPTDPAEEPVEEEEPESAAPDG